MWHSAHPEEHPSWPLVLVRLRGLDCLTAPAAVNAQRDRAERCPLLAQSGHPDTLNQCPLLGE